MSASENGTGTVVMTNSKGAVTTLGAKSTAGLRDDPLAPRVRVIVCIDDTDDVDRTTSTGQIAQLIAKKAETLGALIRSGITRHQLLLRDDVPYTSHNSAMAFEMTMIASCVPEARSYAIDIIAQHRAPTSSPGLCFAMLPDEENATEAGSLERLQAFGRKAKKEFCSVDEAFRLADSIAWVTLSAHGGTGAGVVGALAGAGLRSSGTDGRFRGKWNLADLGGADSQESLTTGRARSILAEMTNGPVRIVDRRGRETPPDLVLEVARECKPVMLDGALTVVCDLTGGTARPCDKLHLGERGNDSSSWNQERMFKREAAEEPLTRFSSRDLQLRSCSFFELDNDRDECFSAEAVCGNCLHRRLLDGGFQCMRTLKAAVAHL